MCADGDPVAADGGGARQGANRQFARQAERHSRLPGRSHAGDSELHRPDRRRLSDHRREQDCGFPAEGLRWR